MTPSGLTLGYHGCDAKLARQVVLGETVLQPGRNGYNWLGEGIYFCARDPLRAGEWAGVKSHSKQSEHAVVGAVINLGHYLNLAERDAME